MSVGLHIVLYHIKEVHFEVPNEDDLELPDGDDRLLLPILSGSDSSTDTDTSSDTDSTSS